VSDETPIPLHQAELCEDDWRNLLLLAHADKSQAYARYVDYYLRTSGQIYWSDEHQLSIYANDYHRAVDATLHAANRATEIITEIYVPRERLADFMAEARNDFRRNEVNVIYGTVRLIERDDQTFLPWATQPYACVVFNLHTEHTAAAVAGSAAAFRRLIDMAIARNGSYFLSYHRFARRDQVEACYPRFAEFLREKRRFDPHERFQSAWYRHYRAMFAV
jgi:FAD/FMN-containing dehydrogenase